MPLLKRKRYISPKLPDGLFVFVLNTEMPNADVDPLQDLDGPFNPGEQARPEDDGTLTFMTEGLPYPLQATRQDGNLLTLETGQVVRIEPWPLRNS